MLEKVGKVSCFGLFLAILVSVILVSGCLGQTPLPTQTPTPTTPTPPSPHIKPPKTPRTPKPPRTPRTPRAKPTPPTPRASTYGFFTRGAYAKYLMKILSPSYTETYVTYEVEGETVKEGSPVWILKQTIEPQTPGMMLKTILRLYIDKEMLELKWWEMEVYQDSKLVLRREGGPGETPPYQGVREPSSPKAQYKVGVETITVPAGTFACDRFEVTQRVQGKPVKIVSWYSADVPIYGLVKYTTYSDGQETSTMELIEYHA